MKRPFASTSLSRRNLLHAIAVVGLGLLTAGAARTSLAEVRDAPPGLRLVGIYRSTTQLVTSPIPLDRDLIRGTDTPQLVTHVVGPINLQAGDRVLLIAREEFTNSSRHLWVMAALGVMRGTAPSPSSGVWVLPPTTENWNNLIHHKTMQQTGWDIVPSDVPNAYYYNVSYFASSPSRHRRGAKVIIEGKNYGKLEVAVFR